MAATGPEILRLLRRRGLPVEIACLLLLYVQHDTASAQDGRDLHVPSPHWLIQPCANGACPLIEKTPFEVRRKIYEMLLPNCDAFVPGQQSQLRVGERCHATIPLLLTSRQISIEVASVLYGERMFEIHLTDEGIRYLNRPPLQTLEELGFKVRVPEGNPKFQRENEQGTFGFSRVRNLHIKIFGSKDAAYMFTGCIRYRHMMKCLVDLMRTNPSNMVEIVVEFLEDVDIWRRRGNIPQPSRLYPLSLIEFISQPLGYLRAVNKVNIILPGELATHAALRDWVLGTRKKMQSPGPYVSNETDQLREQHFERLEQETVDQQIRKKWGFGFYKDDEEKRSEERAINYDAEEPEEPGGEETVTTRRVTRSMTQAKNRRSSTTESTATSAHTPSTTRKRTRSPPEPRAEDELDLATPQCPACFGALAPEEVTCQCGQEAQSILLPFRPRHNSDTHRKRKLPLRTTSMVHSGLENDGAEEDTEMIVDKDEEHGRRRKKRSLDSICNAEPAAHGTEDNGSQHTTVLPIRPLLKQRRDSAMSLTEAPR